MALLVVAPFAVGAGMSLFSYQHNEGTFVGLANFANILLARDWPVFSPLSFYTTLAVTVLWTAANVTLHVGIGVALAMLLREPWLKLRGVYRVLLITPWAIPNYITALIWKGMFQKQFGAINAILGPVWCGARENGFAVHDGLCGQPRHEHLAGLPIHDGGHARRSAGHPPRPRASGRGRRRSSSWQRFRHVTLPLLMPALLPAVVLERVDSQHDQHHLPGERRRAGWLERDSHR